MSYTILFTLTPAFNPNAGGVQQATYKLGRFFSRQGYDISYFSFANDGHVDSQYGSLFHCREEGGVNNNNNIDYMQETCAKVRPDFVINQMPYEFKLTERLGELKSRLDFILLGCLHNSLFSVVNNLEESIRAIIPEILFPVFKNSLGKKLALERHKYLHRKSLKHILANHDRYILLTPPNNSELKYFVGDFMQEKILSIPNSIDHQTPEFSSKRNIILHVGRLNDKQKRSDLLIPFWKACKERLPGWEFVVVGDGPYKRTMDAQISDQNIERIHMAGFQKPEEYYRKASIFMMPSAFEGFPYTILEAQSYGCPVLAFDSYKALSWIVNHEKDAYLSDPFQIDDMVNNAVKLASNADDRLTMQKAAVRNSGRFTTDEVGEEWKKLFSQLYGKLKKVV